ERGKLVAEKILLHPGFVQLDRRRRGDVAHTLGIANEVARLFAVYPQSTRVEQRVAPPEQGTTVEGQRKAQVPRVGTAGAYAATKIGEPGTGVHQRRRQSR